MERIKFADVELQFESKSKSYDEWKEKFKIETGKEPDDFIWETMEKINVKPLYTKDDIKNYEHL
ncbi:MAG: hypothetical protein K9H48_18280, partial [Melioribacteraceae bacterium]|nr:hypothetical protein [Melioribacteraceae bacterium]